MGDSRLEQISQNVLTTIQGVTEDNGYIATLAVQRALKKNEPRHLQAVIYQLSPDDPDEGEVALEQWTQEYAVVVYVLPLETDITPIDQYNNGIAAAIHFELMRDYTRGGLAINTVIKPCLYMPPIDGEFGGITFRFAVVFRHKLDDPFSG